MCRLRDGVVTDDTRIRETLPTLSLAIKKGGRLVSRFASWPAQGRTRSKVFAFPRRQEARRTHREASVRFAADCVGPEPEAKSKTLAMATCFVLENVRFHPEEEKNDEAFSKQLASLCDGVFVCDAFGSAHRAHASVVGITKFVKQSAAGLLMEKELNYHWQGPQRIPRGRSSRF